MRDHDAEQRSRVFEELSLYPGVEAGFGYPQIGGCFLPGNPANFAGILSAPNGIPVVRGMRAYVLSHTWAADNTPLAAEYLTSQIELANVSSGKGSRQDFRYGSLGCSQHADGSWGSPYVIMVGNEIAVLGKAVQTLHATLAQIDQLAKE